MSPVLPRGGNARPGRGPGRARGERPEAGTGPTGSGTITAYFKGIAVDTGTFTTSTGSISWTLDGTKYDSTALLCTDLLNPTQVTTITAVDPSSQEEVTIART